MIKRVYWLLLKLLSGERRVNVYRWMGVTIGKNCRILGRVDFGSEPFLVKVGNDVTITNDVTVLTHDGSVALFRKEFPEMNYYSPVNIGDRVFIGNRSIILAGVTIGNDCIIGAGSVVTKDVSSGWVVAGVPARKIRETKDYKERIMKKAVFISATKTKDVSRLVVSNGDERTI